MEIKEMSMTDVEVRAAEIEKEMSAQDADIEKLSAEVDELEKRKAEIIKDAEERQQQLDSIKANEEITIEKEEVRTFMSDKEMRNSKEYINAYAEYIKTGDDAECRALLTENASGTVAIPELVEDIVRTAWENEGIMRLVRKSNLKGNLKVGFEISGDAAIIHTEGGNAIDPENLLLGVVTLIPKSVKKVVQISDESYDLRGEAFLRYIYDELAHKIAKKVADTLLAEIIACGTVSTDTQVAVPVVATTVGIGTIAQALAELSDQANAPTIVMNKKTWGAFKAAQAGNTYGYDPFEGLEVVYNNTLKAYDIATTGETYAIVGDFGYGALANFPDGEGIKFKFDELTLKKQDLIEVMGREFVAVEPVAPNAFVKITK